ncbi:MAG: phenylalanine--tRNA ligase subunit alpha [Minisyncoccia bacterium]
MISIEEVIKEYKSDIKNSLDIDKLENKYLSRKGYISELFKNLKDIPAGKKSVYGQQLNDFKHEIEDYIKQNITQESQSKLEIYPVHPLDIQSNIGGLSPISRLIFKIQDIFEQLGFSVAVGPELESEKYNFDLLNIPESHPARDVWDTIWVQNPAGVKSLLRTHTSPVQIHYMENNKPPIRIIAPGKVYRYEATDSTHETVFHQVEGLFLDDKASIATFKGVINYFFKELFQQDIKMRLRPSYFPFTEPSFEIDIWLQDKWLEIAGAGMVSRKVLENGGITDHNIQGFAFGLGIERLAMILYGIDDIRLIHSADIRFISQLGKIQL